MATHIAEQEQLEVLKTWWKKHGWATVVVVILGIVLALAVRYWQGYKLVAREEASLLYEQMLTTYAQHEIPAFNQYVERLQKKYAKSPYASAAMLLNAREMVKQNKLPEALQSLNWVVDHAKNKNLHDLALLRAARILIAQEKYDLALKNLNKISEETFAPIAAMLKGDVYLAQSKNDLAKQSYELAKAGMNGNERMATWIRMKLSQVNVNKS